MPTLDDAFEAVRTALLRHFGPATHDFEGLAPFEAMVAVVLDRALGGSSLAGRARRPGDDGLLTPERLADAEIPEIADALREPGCRGDGREPSPPSSSSLAGLSTRMS